jgi:hypothetical protein
MRSSMNGRNDHQRSLGVTADARVEMDLPAGGSDAPYAGIPLLPLPEGVLFEGLDTSLLLGPELPEDPLGEAPRSGWGRIGAAFGEIWHRQWSIKLAGHSPPRRTPSRCGE